MDKIYIGYVGGVHGLRGDLKIKCRFECPDKVFVKGNKIFLNDEEHIITNVKFYKGYYLVTIDNLKDINLVEHYKGFDVFFNRDDLNLNGSYILSDLYDMTITSNGNSYGKVTGISNNGVYNILEIDYKKKYMIPLIDEYVKKVNLEAKTIEVENVEALIL